ncbi:MAG TPA: DUF2130 domain-containing protein, partial [Candidatus Poseidoniaceae archaeon]|nr:DUF2130 domain-containing protein [Candidatus Poseidoniaceae archaeon]
MSEDDNEVICPHCKKIFNIDQSGYANILQQVRDVEFEKQLSIRVAKDKDSLKKDIKLASDAAIREKEKEMTKKIIEIGNLKTQLNNMETEKKLAVVETESEFKEKVGNLKTQLNNMETEKKLEIKDAEDVLKEEIRGLNTTIRQRDEEIDAWKNRKLKMSVKEIGEDLEQWCENQFNILRASAFPNAYFEKDNKSLKELGESKGSKGDYIFRESDSNDVEFVSIMFEMKDKMEDTDGKTNNFHLAELDKNRKKKNCEYAVLVSMLELENDLYNNGIVDKSHKYEKMYVVRPQNFITILTVIRNEARKSLGIRNELSVIRAQHWDIENFENDLENFKMKFNKNYDLASRQFLEAIKRIDTSIG